MRTARRAAPRVQVEAAARLVHVEDAAEVAVRKEHAAAQHEVVLAGGAAHAPAQGVGYALGPELLDESVAVDLAAHASRGGREPPAPGPRIRGLALRVQRCGASAGPL